MNTCYVIQIENPIGYADAMQLQKQAFEMVMRQQIDGIILMLEHKPVLTLGRKGGIDQLKVPEKVLSSFGIEIYKSNRGGNITYHGPGQLVTYPILNLKRFRMDTHWYLRQLESVVITMLKTYGLEAGRKEKYTGVWLENLKIAAIGVHVEKWITTHGFSINLQVDRGHFSLINPCGITEFGIASLEDYVMTLNSQDVLNRVQKSLEEIFEMTLIQRGIDFLEER